MPTTGQFQKTEAVRSATDDTAMSSEQRFWQSFQSVECKSHMSGIGSMSFSPISPYDLALTSSTRLHLYQGSSLRPLKNITKFKDIVVSSSYRHDGLLIAAGTKDRRLKVFDISSRVLLKEFKGHTDTVRTCRFSSESLLQLCSGSDDGTVRLWDLPTGACLQTFTGHDDQVRALAQLSSVWITASFDHTVRFWDPRTGPLPARQVRLAGPCADIRLLRSGAMLGAAGQHGLDVLDLISGRSIHHVPTPTTCLGEHALHQTLIAGSADHQLCFYDLATFQPRHQISMPAAIVSLAVRDDALAIGMADGQVSLRLRRTGPVPGVLAPANPGTKRYFMRGARSVGCNGGVGGGRGRDDYRISYGPSGGSTGPAGQLQPHDVHLKRYEFSAALDAALQTNNPHMIIALLYELHARQALVSALTGRQDTQIQAILKFIVRHITEPNTSDLLQEVAHIILDIYADVLAQSSLTAPIMTQLHDIVQDQVQLRASMMQLTGQIQLLSNT